MKYFEKTSSRILVEIVLNPFSLASFPIVFSLRTEGNCSYHNIAEQFLATIQLNLKKKNRKWKIVTRNQCKKSLTFTVGNCSNVIFCSQNKLIVEHPFWLVV